MRRPRDRHDRRWSRPLSNTRLRAILDSVADGVVAADVQGRLTLVNPAARRILGLGLLDVAQTEWSAAYGCFRPDGVTPMPSDELPLVRAIRGETVADAELVVRNAKVPDGVWLSLQATPLRGPNGDLEGGVVVFRDVTRHRREADRIALLSSVVEQTADGVLVTDAEGRIEYVNPAFEAITGHSREDLLGRTPQMLSSGRHEPAFYTGLWQMLLRGEVFRGTISDRKRSGEVFLAEQTITPMRAPDGRIEHLVSLMKDVTAQRRAEQRESALQVARGVQQRLYPAEPPLVPGLDICGRAFVADVTGGDYYDFVPLPEARLAVVIGDVSGHGIDSALVMAELRAVLRSLAHRSGDPGEMLALANRVLVEDTDDNRFATLLLVALDPASRTLCYASAGHTPGYVLDREGNVRSELASTGPPLGLFADASFRSQDGLTLLPGDALVLLTDGVTDSEAADGTPFGASRALDVVRALRRAPAHAIVRAIHDAVRAFSAPAPQQDDLSIVVCVAAEPP